MFLSSFAHRQTDKQTLAHERKHSLLHRC